MKHDQRLKFEHHSKEYSVTLPMKYIYLNKNTDTVVLMLHGYFDKASAFMRRAFGSEDLPFSILAPNAPFPVPELKQHEVREGYSWYFYNYISQTMVLSPEAGVCMISNLVHDLKLDRKKIVILGFSQGGFLSPLVAQRLPHVRKVISVGAAYRDDFWQSPFNYTVDAIHGTDDLVVSHERAQKTFQEIVAKGVSGKFYSIKDLGHTINDEVRQLIYQKIMDVAGLE